jgi:molybdopterin molybdotransferase
MLTVDQALARLAEIAGVLPIEEVPLGEAAGLVLGEGVVAGRDLPGFDNSAMDGFAVVAADLVGASHDAPVRLRLAGEVAAGTVFDGGVRPGDAVRIMTGAPLPAGADAVVEVEETAIEGGDVIAYREVEPGRSVRPAGSDIRRGDTALPAGTPVGPAQVALLAGLGVTHPRCVRRARVAIVSTGDELVDVATEPGPAQVVDVATPALTAAVRSAGAEALTFPQVPDDADRLRQVLEQASAADLVVSVGGVSMGEYDLVRGVVEEMGELDFWKVRMRPGKPLAVGRLGTAPFIGLPGNPVSALVGFEVFVLPVILAMTGRRHWSRPVRVAELVAPLASPEGLRTFARAQVRWSDDGGKWLADPMPGQASYQMRSMAGANALLDVPEQVVDLDAGDTVRAILIDQPPAVAMDAGLAS